MKTLLLTDMHNLPHLNPLQKRGLEQVIFGTLSLGEGRVRLTMKAYHHTKN